MGDPNADPVVAALAESERRFRTLVQSIRDYAIFMLDPEGRIVTWTEGAARITGYREAEAVGRHFRMFYTPEDQDAGTPEREMDAASSAGRYEGEGFRVRKDGTRFWGNEIITAMREPDDRLVGFAKVIRDLTEHKQLEDTLRAREERHRLLVENVRDYAIFMEDIEGRVVTWNRGAQRIFGYEDAEIIGQRGAVLFTPEDRAAGEHARELRTALAEGRAADERWHLRKDGGRFWASGVMAPLRDDAGAPVGFVKVCRDLTERRKLEEQQERLLERERLARQEAERAVTIRDEFLSVVSHELGTPMAVILLWARLLRSGSVHEGQRRKALEAIEQSAVALQQQIEDLVDMSRMMSGKLRLDVREVELRSVVEAAVEAVRPMAEAKGVTVRMSRDERVHTVRADPDRLQQVVWNLVSNAVKFTGQGGRVEVALDRPNGGVRIRVTDTGRGIRPDFLPHVFEMFRQADASTTRAHGGLGLGLAITRQLVELHGGTIQVESDGEGRGATFTVELPLGDVVHEVGQPAPTNAWTDPGKGFVPSPRLQGVRVLLTEDEDRTRDVVAWLLEQCGAHVTAVASAAEALATYEKSLGTDGYDVLVCDIGMAGRDGYQLLGDIRALELGRGVPRPTAALALTAYARDEDRQKAFAAGFQSHLAKPVEPGVLIAEVARLVGRTAPGA